MTVNLKKTNPRINKISYNNKCYTDKSSICDQPNTSFINVGPNLSDQLPKHGNLNTTTAIKCVKIACDYICKAKTELYNQSLAQGIVPDILKIAKVTPTDKGGRTDNGSIHVESGKNHTIFS